MYYLVYKKKDNMFYGWTDSKEIIYLFMKIHKDKYFYIKTKTLLEPGMEKFELYIEDYQLDAYFQGQTDVNKNPLILRMDEFGLLEASIYNSLYFLSDILKLLSELINYYRNKKDEKQMMISSCNLLFDNISEIINDDEPIYNDIIDIIKFYEKIGIKEIKTVVNSRRD